MAKQVAGIVAVLLVLLAGIAAYRWRAPRYTVTQEDDGSVVSRVVVANLQRADALKVASVSGVVQSTASSSRLDGLLTADQLVKAPFSVDYFVDLSHLSSRDVTWDARSRSLSVNVPEVSVGRPNVDQSAVTLVRTRGLFVTRDASQEMFRKGAAAATRVAGEEARKPQWMALAREHARADLATLLGAPLAAAGRPAAAIHVVFPFERRSGDDRRWDVSRSVEDVLRDTK